MLFAWLYPSLETAHINTTAGWAGPSNQLVSLICIRAPDSGQQQGEAGEGPVLAVMQGHQLHGPGPGPAQATAQLDPPPPPWLFSPYFHSQCFNLGIQILSFEVAVAWLHKAELQLTSRGYNLTNNRAQSRRELNLSFSIIKQTSRTDWGRGLATTKSFFKDDPGQATKTVYFFFAPLI